jgi:hypothetical protein
MIEAVIMPRFATGTRASLLTLPSIRLRKNCPLSMISRADEFAKQQAVA